MTSPCNSGNELYSSSLRPGTNIRGLPVENDNFGIDDVLNQNLVHIKKSSSLKF